MLTVCINRERKRSRLSITHSHWLLPLLCVWFLLPSVCRATSVEQINTDQLIAESELVIDARVTAVQVRSANPGALPSTHATLEIIDIIKGSYAERAIELVFLGGTLEGRSLTIPGMHPPQIGERGIYFIASLSRNYAHPLRGWDQGHYVVRADEPSGELRVYTRALQPVTGMEQPDRDSLGLSKGYAAGLKVQPDAEDAVALPVMQFKTELRRKVGVQP